MLMSVPQPMEDVTTPVRTMMEASPAHVGWGMSSHQAMAVTVMLDSSVKVEVGEKRQQKAAKKWTSCRVHPLGKRTRWPPPACGRRWRRCALYEHLVLWRMFERAFEATFINKCVMVSELWNFEICLLFWGTDVSLVVNNSRFNEGSLFSIFFRNNPEVSDIFADHSVDCIIFYMISAKKSHVWTTITKMTILAGNMIFFPVEWPIGETCETFGKFWKVSETIVLRESD